MSERPEILYKVTDWPLGEGDEGGESYPNVHFFDSHHTAISCVQDLMKDYWRNALVVNFDVSNAEDREEGIVKIIETYFEAASDLEWARYEDGTFDFDSGLEAVHIEPIYDPVPGTEYRDDAGDHHVA